MELSAEIKTERRILVVEDSPELQTLLKMALQEQGYRVFCSNNGKDALNYLKNSANPTDLILLDLMMPIMDGYEFRRQQLLDKKFSMIPVVVMTADENFSANDPAMRIKNYLKKPMELGNLTKIIDNHFS